MAVGDILFVRTGNTNGVAELPPVQHREGRPAPHNRVLPGGPARRRAEVGRQQCPFIGSPLLNLGCTESPLDLSPSSDVMIDADARSRQDVDRSCDNETDHDEREQ